MRPCRINSVCLRLFMPSPIENPILTKLYEDWQAFKPQPGSTFLHGTSVEERSVHPADWELVARDVHFVRLSSHENSPERDFSHCTADAGGCQELLQLRSTTQLSNFFEKIKSKVIYLDITGLPHHVWAPLLRAAIAACKQISAVYVEPRTYTFSRTPTEAEIFDLSETIHGISPLPGFSVLGEPKDEDLVLFVPFLGFEGHRFAYVVEQVQPPGKKIVPVVGVPGFAPVFPFHTYLGNKNILAKGALHAEIRLIMANSAFDAFYLLHEISAAYPDHTLKVAPIGTKPHALGVVLFTILFNRPVEIVYDHPIRKPNRSTGSANILVYEVSQLLSSL